MWEVTSEAWSGYGGGMEGERRGKGGVVGGCRRFSVVRKCPFVRHSPLPKSSLFYPSDSYLTIPDFFQPRVCNPRNPWLKLLLLEAAQTTPGVSPPPLKLPSKRWRDLILRVWHVDENHCFPGRFEGGLLPGTGLLRPGLPRNLAAARALPGRSAAAARLRSWRWGRTARKPAKLAC
jgi:hypothetical protein